MGYGTPSERAELSADCMAARIQAGPGEYGFYPLLDRSGGGGAAGPTRPAHYFQVILQEPDALSGIPECVFRSCWASVLVDLLRQGLLNASLV